MKIALFVFMIFSLSVSGEWAFAQNTDEILQNQYSQMRESKFVLIPYRANYLLPVVYDWMPNESIYSNLKKVEPDNENSNFYTPVEAEFQISFAIPLVRDFKDKNWDFFFAYTHHAWWQVYNKEWSRPFRETNYMPELFASYYYDNPKVIMGMNLLSVDMGYAHQSNGQIQTVSRGWDRLFLRRVFAKEDFKFVVSGGGRLPTSVDDNPDIYNFMGLGELEIIKDFWGASFLL